MESASKEIKSLRDRVGRQQLRLQMFDDVMKLHNAGRSIGMGQCPSPVEFELDDVVKGFDEQESIRKFNESQEQRAPKM